MLILSAVLALFVAGSAAHGVVTVPVPRAIGPVNEAACGAPVYTELESNIYGPIENSAKVADSTYNATECHLFLCRGYQYADNIDNTRVYTPGTVVNFNVVIEARHTGYANVSVVDLVAQEPIATLFNWPVYANDSLAPADYPANETNFNVTIPDLGSACSSGGACAIQWWWYGTAVKQTYESCVDFTQ